MEDSTQTGLGTAKLGTIAETFCDTLQEQGYAVGIYANLNWWNTYLTDDAFDNDTWYKWVARWPKTTGITDSGIDDADLWQFSCKGTVSGISGDVDMSFDYIGADAYLPTKPKTMTLKSVSLNSSHTSATLTWKKLTYAKGYRIYRSTNGGSYEVVATITNLKTTSWTDTTISYGNTYTYRIRAYNKASSGTKVWGGYSSKISVTTKPKQVTLKSVTLSDDESYVKVKWTALSKGTGYRVYRSTDGGSYERIATITDLSTTSYKDTTVESGHTYTYKVRAYILDTDNTKVFGSYSSTKSVTTSPDKVKLTSVKSNTDRTKVTIKWTALSACDGYHVYRSTDGGSYEKIAVISSASTSSYKDTTVTAGHTYAYKVRAYKKDASGTKVYGSYSAKKTVTLPAKMTLSSVKANTSLTKVTVKWKALSNVDGYRIYRSTDGGSYERIATITDITTTSYKDSTIDAGHTYTYKVRAYVYDEDGNKFFGSYSSKISVEVKPAQMTLVSVKKNSANTKTRVTWEALSGVDGYQIYRSTDGGTYERIATIKDITTTSYQDTTVASGHTYTYKVRAYKKNSSGTNIFGSCSNKISIAIK